MFKEGIGFFLFDTRQAQDMTTQCDECSEQVASKKDYSLTKVGRVSIHILCFNTRSTPKQGNPNSIFIIRLHHYGLSTNYLQFDWLKYML